MPGSSGPLRYSSWEPQPLPEPWIVASADMRFFLEAELRAEVADGHTLSGETVTAIARCQACNGVRLLRVADDRCPDRGKDVEVLIYAGG